MRIGSDDMLITRLIVSAILVVLIAGTAHAVDVYAIDAYTQDEYWEDQLHSYALGITWIIGPNASYSGISSTVVGLEGISPQTGAHTPRDFTGGEWAVPFDPALWLPPVEVHLGTTARIRAGAGGDTATTVSMAWRSRTDIEVDSRGYPMDGIQMPPMAYDSYGVISDVLDLNGVVGEYVLEMDYSDDARVITGAGWPYTEDGMAALGFLYLGWFEDTPSGGVIPTVREWVNAVDGNSGAGSHAVRNYLGSYDDFLTDPLYSDTSNLSKYLGSWGVDTTGNTMWAILDHNSEFSAVPEPATLSLLGIGGVALLRCRRK